MSRIPAVKTENDIFAIRLRALMEGPPRVTQEDLANYVGVKRQTIALYASGKTKPNINQLVRIAKYFNVSSDWLIGLAENKRPEYQNVGDLLGLNDNAIEKLKNLSHYEHTPTKIAVMRFINDFFTDEFFYPVLSNYLSMCSTSELFARFTLELLRRSVYSEWRREIYESKDGYALFPPLQTAAFFHEATSQRFGDFLNAQIEASYLEKWPAFLPEVFFELDAYQQRSMISKTYEKAKQLCLTVGLTEEDVKESLNSML